MNKKLIPICIASLVYLAAAVGAVSADEPLPGKKYTLTEVKVIAVDRTKTDDGKTTDKASDKLTHWIRFDVFPKFEREASPKFAIVDPVVDSETKLTLDKPIKFEGELVPAGTNLLKFKKFNGKNFNISVPGLVPLAIHSATIKRGFEIPADDYNVTFEWTTKSGKKITTSVEVNIDVELPPGEPEQKLPKAANLS